MGVLKQTCASVQGFRVTWKLHYLGLQASTMDVSANGRRLRPSLRLYFLPSRNPLVVGDVFSGVPSGP